MESEPAAQSRCGGVGFAVAKELPARVQGHCFHGDFPVVWTNRRYRMIYLNMGHGGEAFTNGAHNLLFMNVSRLFISTEREPVRMIYGRLFRYNERECDSKSQLCQKLVQ